MTEDAKKRRKAVRLVTAYPVALVVIAVIVNVLALKVNPMAVALPSPNAIVALAISGALLLINHTWLMTATELTRVRFNLSATPEEWAESGRSERDAPEQGLEELRRHHNAHRNTTENTVYYVFLAVTLALTSPTDLAVQVWGIVFGLARLGYTFSYLKRENRGTRHLYEP